MSRRRIRSAEYRARRYQNKAARRLRRDAKRAQAVAAYAQYETTGDERMRTVL